MDPAGASSTKQFSAARGGRRTARRHSCGQIPPDAAGHLTGCYDGTIRISDIATGRELSRTLVPAREITSLDVSKNGELVVSGSADGAVRLWNTATPKRPP